MPTRADSISSVEALPRARADRGIFRSFSAARAGGKLRCSFAWLTERPLRLNFDPARARVRRRNRDGSVSISIASLDGDLDYAVSRALKLVNEIFLGFLRGPYLEGMAENFNEPQD